MLMPDRRIFFNLDDTHFFYTRADDRDLSEETIRSSIRQYEGTQISDFALCCSGRIADYPSQVRMWWGDKYDQTVENGLPVDYKAHPVVRCAARLYRELGLDFYAICIDELRNIGIRPHLSFRMNDCHCTEEPASFLHPDFYHQHPELRRVTHREPDGYFDRCYDYGQEAVRQEMLAFIAEALDRYDADGIELDWQREISCFRPGCEWAGLGLLTGFMHQVRAIADRAGEKWGRRILITVRIPAAPQTALDLGFDAVRWAREGLADVIVPCPRWETADSDIPTELWRQLLSGTDALLAAGVELLQRATPQARFLYTTSENVHALAAQYLTMGADMLYLYNYFDRMDGEQGIPERSAGSRTAVSGENYLTLLHTVGSEETAVHSERRHVKTYHDVAPLWESPKKNTPLPLTASRSSVYLRMRTGAIPPDAAVEVRLGADYAGENPFTVWAGSEPCAYLRKEPVVPAYTDCPAQVYKIENNGCLPPFIVLEIRSDKGEIPIDYAEIHILP